MNNKSTPRSIRCNRLMLCRAFAMLSVIGAFPMFCIQSGCSRPAAGVNMQAGLEFYPDDGRVRAVIVQNPSTHEIKSATVQMDFHLGNGDVLTKKQEVDRIDKESQWRYQLDDSIRNVVSIDIIVSGADGRGKMTLRVPSKDGASVNNGGAPLNESAAAPPDPAAERFKAASLWGEWEMTPPLGEKQTYSFGSQGSLEIRIDFPDKKQINFGTWELNNDILSIRTTRQFYARNEHSSKDFVGSENDTKITIDFRVHRVDAEQIVIEAIASDLFGSGKMKPIQAQPLKLKKVF